MWLGLGLLGSFFLASGIIIYRRNQARIPDQAGSLSRELIEGVHSPAPITSSPTAGTPEPASGVGIVWNQFHRSLVQDGKMVWEIFGTRGEYDPAASIARIAEPDLTVIRDNGEKVRLTAGRAEINIQGTELTTADLFDNVVVTYQADTTVKTSRAIYDRKAGRVDIPVPVELENPLFSVKGKKLVALLEPQEITITDGVQTTIKPRKK